MKDAGFDKSTDNYGNGHLEGKSWFLGIGISEYQNSRKFRKLSNAEKDVRDIHKCLCEKYHVETLKLLLGREATVSAIINTLHDCVDSLSEEDKLLIYFSGHGRKKASKSNRHFDFWVPFDADPDDYHSVIGNAQIIDIFDKIPARHVFLISDSCYSGSFLDSRAGIHENEEIHLPRARVHELYESKKSRWGLFSANGNQVAADGPPGKNSPFAAAILTVISQHQGSYINAGLFGQMVIEQAARNTSNQNAICNIILNCGDDNGQYVFWQRERPKPMPPISSEKTREKPENKSLSFPAYPAEGKLAKNIPSINKKTLYAMEKSLRQTCELMLKNLEIPIQADRWALRDYCTNKAHVTVDLLNEIQDLKEGLGQFSLSSASLFNRVVGIQNKFTQHLSQKQFQFTDTETSAELFQFIKSPLFKTDAKLQESKRIVQQAFEDNLEQKNILRDYLIDTSIQLQLLYLILEKIVSSTGGHELPSHIMN